jgi:nicotinate-nucleotide adenylyltransferase
LRISDVDNHLPGTTRITQMGNRPMNRLGILGGTFNPIHIAHLLVAEQVAEARRLDKVLFIPACIPPHKDSPDIAPPEDRYRMTALATESNPRFEVSRIELDRPGRSFTKDTLQQLLEIYPGAELFYIIGSDAVAELSTWREPELVLELANFLVAMRPGHDLARLEDRFRKSVEVVHVSGLDVSSTDIRERVRKGFSIKYLVPEKVEQYIAQKGLYQGYSAQDSDALS